jgi:hypothetical protein
MFLFFVPHVSDCEDGNGLYDDYININHETGQKRVAGSF